MRRVLIVFAVLLFCAAVTQAEEARLLRFPHVSADKVAFSYAGDIYTAPREGGQATRLTSHEGLEIFARFSPDGSRIAFTGQYDGDQSVYVLPVEGGMPQRLTWHPGIQNSSERMGPENVVLGWHPDGERVLFRSRKESIDAWDGRVYLVGMDGALPEPLPMASAGFTSFSPDAKWVAFCPIYRDFRTWKRYKGGMAQDVWVFDMETLTSEKITDWEGTDNKPMWYANKIYFNSDRTGTLNLYSYDIQTKDIVQVTDFTEYDVRWPSLGVDAIVFENGGWLYVMDLPSEEVHKVDIDIITDHSTMRSEFKDVSGSVSGWDISPNAKRVVFEARGDLFTVPAEEGNTRKLVTRSSSKEEGTAWSPDGKWIVYTSDVSGEQEYYMVAHDGSETIQLTSGSTVPRRDPIWSPDSKLLTYTDATGRLWYFNVEDRQAVKIDSAQFGGLWGGMAWSPDSRFIAYSKNLENRIDAIHIYSFDDGMIHQVTEGFTNDYSPEFSTDGKYLFFVSQRNFNPILSDYEFAFVNQAIENLFLIVLEEEGESPFAPGSDEAVEEDAGDEEAIDEEDAGDGEESDDVRVNIDFEGIFERQVAVDLPSGNYGGLTAIDDALFYMSYPIYGLRGKVTQEESALHKYDIDKEKDHEFATGISGYTLTPDGKHMLVRKGGGFHIVSTGGSSADFSDGRLDLGHLETEVDHVAEYEQMFYEVWRAERDYFYDSNMHGVDWEATRDKYAVMLPYVHHRFDLLYLIGEMISELACSHTYVGGGEYPKPEGSDIGLLGVDFFVDPDANRIRIDRILQGENFDEGFRSPLRRPGVDVGEGDYLLAINGRELTGDMNPYQLTENTLGQKVTLTINDRPTMDGARDIQVEPIGSEAQLRYYSWVRDRRDYVDSVSNGEIGYLHIPDMGSFGLYRFTKMFYNQMRKPGLVLDVRWNGGGFVSGLILERLRRVVKGMGKGRYNGPWRNPGAGIHAHMITLHNEFSCSDGDIFPYFFRQYELGPLMGKRTWGGVIGINGFTRLVDGGYFTVPGFGMYDLEGEWVVENVGVAPDIEVENRPERLALGYDDQLDRAIEHILKRLEQEPMTLPEVNGPPTPR